MKRFAGLAAAAMLGACAGTGGANLPVVSGVDLDRYAGRWHEVASMPAWFQRKCASDTTADYAPTPDGRISVVNRCREADGSTREATGVARPTGAPGEGKLEVSFLSVFGIPLWPAAGDYWIIALDPDYRWSVVGHPSREYGWILSRTPTLPAATLRELRGRLAAAGYDTCKLIVTQDAAKPRLCDV